MMSNQSTKLLKRGAIAVLAGVLAFTCFQLLDGSDSKVAADVRLAERLDQYVDLRMRDDWNGVYEMCDPTQRDQVRLRDYLVAYDHGVTKLHGLRQTGMKADWPKHTAYTAFEADSELLPERMPAAFRAGFRAESPADLRQALKFEVTWVWRDSEWFLRMDPEIATGQDSEGNAVTFHDRGEGS